MWSQDDKSTVKKEFFAGLVCTHKSEFDQLLGRQLFCEQNGTKIYSGCHADLQQTKPLKRM